MTGPHDRWCRRRMYVHEEVSVGGGGVSRPADPRCTRRSASGSAITDVVTEHGLETYGIHDRRSRRADRRLSIMRLLASMFAVAEVDDFGSAVQSTSLRIEAVALHRESALREIAFGRNSQSLKYTEDGSSRRNAPM